MDKIREWLESVLKEYEKESKEHGTPMSLKDFQFYLKFVLIETLNEPT